MTLRKLLTAFLATVALGLAACAPAPKGRIEGQVDLSAGSPGGSDGFANPTASPSAPAEDQATTGVNGDSVSGFPFGPSGSSASSGSSGSSSSSSKSSSGGSSSGKRANPKANCSGSASSILPSKIGGFQTQSIPDPTGGANELKQAGLKDVTGLQVSQNGQAAGVLTAMLFEFSSSPLVNQLVQSLSSSSGSSKKNMGGTTVYIQGSGSQVVYTWQHCANAVVIMNATSQAAADQITQAVLG